MPRRPRLALITWFLVLAGLQGAAEPAPVAGFAGAFRWTLNHPDFGGLSGIEMSADGKALLALTDKARLISATVERDAAGQITGVAQPQVLRLQDRIGKPLDDGHSDSEGLALSADGRLFVSFESPGRVLDYATPTANTTALPSHADFADMAINAALEALAIDATGTLYTLEEAKVGTTGHQTLYRFRNGTWDDSLHLPQQGNFLPVGADFGPDGRLYLLDRSFVVPFGFANRLRRFDIGENAVTGETLLMRSATGQFDNLESVSIWRNAQGQLVATMVADNNFLPVLRTQLVEVILPD